MRFLVSIVCICYATLLSAQFSGIDPQNFPLIRAYGGGSLFANAKTSDFAVTENGIAMTNGLSVQCSTAVNDPSVSVVLVIDISESMNERMSNGRTKLEWMKNGAKNFINSLVFNGTTQCAIITFNGQSYILSDFKTSARPLNEAIDSIQYGLGATNYEAPLIDPQKSAVALLKKTPAWVRRVVVFLTDGTPNQDPPVASIVNQLNQLQATVFAIALSFDASPELREIADKTGGTTSVANTEDLLVNIYKDLGNKRPTTTYCWLSYTAPMGCTEASRNRNVQIIYKPTNLRQNFTYIAPPKSVAQLQISQLVLPPFPDISPGQQATQQLTITANYADFTVTGDASTLPANFRISDWGGTPPPFTLKSGQSRVITIQFTQTSPRDIRSGRVRVNASPCNSEYVSLSGGAKKVVIVSPNGGETLSSCDSIIITWGGVDAIDTVRLQYSTNSGNTWELISNTATGLSHQWKAPSNGQYLFRIAAKTTRSGGMSNVHCSGTGIEIGRGISANEHASSYAVIGQYEKQCSMNGQQIASTRTQDMFLGRLRESSVLWLKTGVQFFSQYLPYTLAGGKAVLMDKQDDMFTATDIVRTVNAGRGSIILQKITSTGSVDWTKEILGTQKTITAQSFGIDSLGNYYLIGSYDGQLSIPVKTGGTSTINTTAIRPFTLVFNGRGDILALKDSLTTAYPLVPADSSRDSLGTLYTVKTFVNTITLPDTNFRSAGKQDIAIRMSGRILTPPDQSDAACSIILPLLTLNQFRIDIPPVNIGSSIDTVMSQYLCNRSDTPIILDEPIITNGNGLFVIEPKAGTVIPGDTCIQVLYRFIPSQKGQQKANVTFGNACTFVSGIINTEAISLGASISNQDWGRQRILTSEQKVIQLRNTGDTDINVDYISSGSSTVFTFPSLPTYPTVVKAKSTLDILCDFTPQDTISYLDSLLIRIAKIPDPLIAKLTGQGGLPTFQANDYVFAPTNVGSLSGEQGTIRAINQSTTMPLRISSSSILSPDGDFFIIGRDSIPALIDNGINHATMIGFKPVKSGKRNAWLTYAHDAAPGPEQQPIKYDSVLIEGMGISNNLTIDSLLDFGTILTCDIATIDLIINNPNDQDISIVGITISDLPGNTFASAFSTAVNTPIAIPAKGFARLPIRCTPESIGQINAILTCLSEDGTTYTTYLVGYGEQLSSTTLINGSSAQTIPISPGGKNNFDIFVSLQKQLPIAVIDSIDFVVEYPNTLLQFDSVISLNSNWNISMQSHDPMIGKALIQAHAINPVSAFSASPLFRMFTSSYLGDIEDKVLSFKSIYTAPCITSSEAQSRFSLSNVCFSQGRIITLMNDCFAFTLNKETITIHLPFDAMSEASIIDINGRTMSLLPLSFISKGMHEFVLPHLPQGVYALMVKHGMYTMHDTFIIHDSSIFH